MSLKVLPVAFTGLVWGHPEHKHGRRWRPQDRIPEKLDTYREQLQGVHLAELYTLEDRQQTAELLKLAAEADVVLCAYSELLASTWAATALEQSPVPVILHNMDNYPGAVMTDVYGYLHSRGCDARLALNMTELAGMIAGLAAKKRLSETTMLIIGDAFPSPSQAASIADADLLQQRLGVEPVLRSIDAFMGAYQAANEGAAREQADAWFAGAERIEAREAIEPDIVEIAKVYLAIRQMIDEAGANAFTIDCRDWDELTMEKFGRFYGPCMSLTTLRFDGIPAACEGDVCGLLGLCALTYVSGLPAFLGNIGRVNPDEGWIAVEHASAAPNMDGSRDELAGYWLTDYQNRGTGCASYCSVPAGFDATVARFDRNLESISFFTGVTRETERCFEVETPHVEDFMHRCLIGDHHGVVYGDHSPALRVLAESLGMGILEAGKGS